jgi:hypothetical protein
VTPQRPTRRRYRCTLCGVILNAGLAWTTRPNGALLSGHLSQNHPVELRPYLARMAEGADIAWTSAELYEVIEEDET